MQSSACGLVLTTCREPGESVGTWEPWEGWCKLCFHSNNGRHREGRAPHVHALQGCDLPICGTCTRFTHG
jgi:hypothetical protein